MPDIINKTMCRADLLADEARPVIEDLNDLVRRMYERNAFMSAWVGSLLLKDPSPTLKDWARYLLGRSHFKPGESGPLQRGMAQRLDYTPLPDAADDLRLPWFLYWEIYWVLKVTGPYLEPGMRLFDGGGASSLFSCYLASQGYEVHSIDLNQDLVENGKRIADVMGWDDLHSHVMNLGDIDFPAEYFDHAYSICVFEHLDYDIKQRALAQIARSLKPGGIFAITFDYRNPAPGIFGYGKDTRPRNQLKTIEDIHRSFLSTDYFELMGNQDFVDNGKSYLVHQRFDNTPYTFGAIFLRKKS